MHPAFNHFKPWPTLGSQQHLPWQQRCTHHGVAVCTCDSSTNNTRAASILLQLGVQSNGYGIKYMLFAGCLQGTKALDTSRLLAGWVPVMTCAPSAGTLDTQVSHSSMTASKTCCMHACMTAAVMPSQHRTVLTVCTKCWYYEYRGDLILWLCLKACAYVHVYTLLHTKHALYLKLSTADVDVTQIGSYTDKPIVCN